MDDFCLGMLMKTDDPFHFSSERDELFFSSMRESFLHHYETSISFKKLCNLDGFSSDLFLGYSDIFFIPHLYIPLIFREDSSIPECSSSRFHACVGSFSSSLADSGKDIFSGSGDGLSSFRTEEMILPVLPRLYRDFCGYDSSFDLPLYLLSPVFSGGTAGNFSSGEFGIFLSGDSGFSGGGSISCEVEGVWEHLDPDVEGVIEFFGEISRSGRAICISGSADRLYFLYRECCRNNLPNFRFNPGSYLFVDKNCIPLVHGVPPPVDLSLIFSHWLGIPADHIREVFTVPGHGIPYSYCEAGHMHIPVYSRVVCRDPESLRIHRDGSPGLLHFFSPFSRMFPTLSLLSPHMGVLGRSCPCGRNAPYMDVLRRKRW